MNKKGAKDYLPWAIGLGGLGLLVTGLLLAFLLPYVGSFSLFRRERIIVNSTLQLSVKWTFDAGAPLVKPPVVVLNLVLVKTTLFLIAVDSITGKKVWQIPDPTNDIPPLSLAWDNDTVAFESNDRFNLNVANLRDGATLWSKGVQSPFEGQISRIAMDDKKVYIERGRGSGIRAYSLADGRLLWTSQQFSGSSWNLTVNDTDLYMFNGIDLHILDTETGQIKKDLIGAFFGDWRVFSGDSVYESLRGAIAFVDIETGQTGWTFDHYLEYFTAINDRVYVSSETAPMYALDQRTGALLWQETFGVGTSSYMAHIGETGYLMLDNGSIVAFDLASGSELGRLQTTPSSVSPFLLGDGLDTDGQLLFATFGDSKLFAFGK